MSTVHDIVKKYLTDNKFDGLVSNCGECSCTLDDLFPCGAEGVECCVAGHKTTCDSECEIHCGGDHITEGPK